MHTIRDVARLADVSLGTASKVINKKGVVSSKLRQRVLSAMEALDYHPDQIARSLKLRETHTIGMLIPDVTNPFFTDVIRAVENEARAHAYSLILCDSNENPVVEQTNLNTLFARRVDGVLIAPVDAQTAQDRFTRRRFPIVFFDRVPPSFKGAAVVTDNLGAAYEATHHLIELGHRRIATIAGHLNLSNGLDRLEGFRKALQHEGLLLPDEYLQRGDFQFESGYECGLKLLRLAAPPTAIFCCNNKMTLGLMRALAEEHVPCPARVSVLGFDDFDWAANFSPRLTTVAQPTSEMGKQAILMLLRKIEAARNGPGSGEDKVLVLPGELRVRDSTAPPGADG
ncbi:MAG: LacI family DNA-binding transcriptional regulator [Acidobacteriota bacterium]|nr:LacI family DNA-binding transcriptional regulator [Acidobacteriota bacterium]